MKLRIYQQRFDFKSKFELSKYSSQITTILFVFILTINASIYSQDPLWIIGDQTVSFTNGDNPMISPTPLPTPDPDPDYDVEWFYNGQVAQLHQKAQYDEEGNLLFFIIDGYIYNKDGFMIADPDRIYTSQGPIDNNFCEVCILGNQADIIVSQVPGTCNLYYIVFVDVFDNVNYNIEYLILDIDRINPFFGDPEILGGLVDIDNIDEYPNFPENLFELDEANYDHKVVLVSEGGQSPTKKVSFMESVDIVENGKKKMYVSYGDVLRQFDIRSDKIELEAVYLITPGIGIEEIGGLLPNSNISLAEELYYEVDTNGSGYLPPPPSLDRGDMQITWIDNLEKYVLVFKDTKVDGGAPFHLLYIITLDEIGAVDNFHAVANFSQFDIFGFSFSPRFGNGSLFINSTWPDFEIRLLFITDNSIGSANLLIDQVVYSQNEFNFSRMERAKFNGHDAFVVLGNNSIGVLENFEDDITLQIVEFDSNIDITEYSAWAADEPESFLFRMLTNQDYSNATWEYNFLETECCLPELNDVGYGDMSFTGDETWTYGNNPFGNTSDPILVKGTFTFENGSKIDIKDMEFRFGPNAKIMIEPGARLIVDGSTLTSACNVYWRGLFVIGNTNQIQSYSNQGYLITKNGALISNANYAVRNYGLTANGKIDPNKSGGIIRSTETTFLNNKTDVRMRTYKKYYLNGAPKPDLSYFRNSDFITDHLMFEQSDVLHMNLYDVNSVAIKGCFFSDNRGYKEIYDKSIGISANNAAFKIADYGSINSVFTNLQYAIKAWNYSEATIIIDNATFNCYKGIYFNGIEHSEILSNTFFISKQIDHITTDDFDLPYGLYFDQCADYKTESNKFEGDDNGYTLPNFGLVVHNGHGINTTIRDNEFYNLTVGVEAVGQNKNEDPIILDGLELRCNNNTLNEFDFAVVKLSGELVNGIALNQGQAGNETTDPAGNLFSTGNQVDVNYQNKGDDFNYFHHNPISESRVIPTTDGSINLFESQEPFNPELSCINPGDDGGGDDDEIIIKLSQMSVASGSIEQINSELNILIDGGNTQEMQSDVVMTTDNDAWVNYLQLMAESGYLSEDVLAEVSKKETGFSQAMIRNILAANPQAAKSSEIQKNLDERLDPLPDYMREQINFGLTQISPKEYLEWMRGNQKRRYDLLQNQVLKTWMTDTVVNHTTEIIDLLSNTGDFSKDYRLVDYYDSKGESTLGDLLLDVINSYPLSNIQQEDYNNYNDFRNLLRQWKQNGLDMEMLDEAQITTLNDFALMRYPIGARAMALLSLNNELDYNEPLFIPESGDKNYTDDINQYVKESNNLLVLFPNPSNDYFTVDYSLVEAFNNGKLIILDANGKTIHQDIINFTRDQIIIAVDNWPSGQYSCVILTDGKTMLTEKITIIK